MMRGGGGNKCFEVVLTQEVLAILMGGAKSFHPIKRGAQKVLPCLKGGGAQNVSDPRFSY